MADTNTNYLTKVEMDWEEIDRKVKLHRKKQLRRLAIIAACCVAGFAALYIGSQLKTYNKYKVIMTREKDTGLYSEGDTNKKIADLSKRIEIMNGSDAAAVVSIHQNSFTGESSRGAQVFYHGESQNGKKFAGIMQKKKAECIGDGNHRVEKANSDYYVLRKSIPTAIIVECGFLSNSQEAKLLSDDEYQKKMAKAIAKGIYEYIS